MTGRGDEIYDAHSIQLDDHDKMVIGSYIQLKRISHVSMTGVFLKVEVVKKRGKEGESLLAGDAKLEQQRVWEDEQEARRLKEGGHKSGYMVELPKSPSWMVRAGEEQQRKNREKKEGAAAAQDDTHHERGLMTELLAAHEFEDD